MYRCPHCRERTIGVWAKAKANGWRPSACPDCGGKYVPAVWGQLPALVALFAGWFGPLAMAGSTAGTMGYAGALALFVLFAAIYLRDEEPAVQQASAELPPGYELGSMTVSQVDPALHEELKAALAKAGVRFELDKMEDGREALRLRHDQVQAYERVERELWGERPPADGRSVHMSPDAAQRDFQKWLSDAGIAHRVVTYQRKDYVVWDGEPYLWKKFHAERPSDCAKPRAQVDASKRC